MSHGAPSWSATCVHPVEGSHTSTVHELPSSQSLAVVQPSVTVVLVEVEVAVDVEEVVAGIEVEEVLVAVGGRVVVDVVGGAVVEVVDDVDLVVLVVEWVVEVEDVVWVVEVEEEVLVVVGGRVVDVDVLVDVEVVVEVLVADPTGCSVRYMRKGHGPAVAPQGLGEAFWHELPQVAVVKRELPETPLQAPVRSEPHVSPLSVVLKATQYFVFGARIGQPESGMAWLPAVAVTGTPADSQSLCWPSSYTAHFVNAPALWLPTHALQSRTV